MGNICCLVAVLLSVFLWHSEASQMEGYRYCPPEEWEGGMHLSAASELNYFELLMYTNGTIHIAYSVPLQKIYLGMHLTQNSSYSPEAMTFNVTYLYDFEKGILYEVTSVDNNCTKSNIPVNNTEQCVPADAALLSKSYLGDDYKATISTYRFSIPSVGLPWHVRTTVHETGTPGICDPVHVVYATDVEADVGGIVYSFDIFDMRPLNSTDIFKVPKQCLK